MQRKGGFFYGFFLISLLVALGFSAYYLYQFWPREPVNLHAVSNESNVVVQNDLPSKQFYQRMRYQDRIISYSISDSCATERVSAMKRAFSNIESLTVLKFEPVLHGDPMLHVLCSNLAPEAGHEDYFVAGEGGPSRVLNSTLYSIILEGKIALYRDDTCEGGKVATHELLHALGFDHNNNPRSILYPTLKCDQEIDSEIIQSINKLYLQDNLPDLFFFSTAATKSGRYLNFNVEVLNQGLRESAVSDVKVYADNELAGKFDIGSVGVGARKILNVENLKIPLDASTIVFIVDEDNKVIELFENNNQATLRLV